MNPIDQQSLGFAHTLQANGKDRSSDSSSSSSESGVRSPRAISDGSAIEWALSK